MEHFRTQRAEHDEVGIIAADDALLLDESWYAPSRLAHLALPRTARGRSVECANRHGEVEVTTATDAPSKVRFLRQYYAPVSPITFVSPLPRVSGGVEGPLHFSDRKAQ